MTQPFEENTPEITEQIEAAFSELVAESEKHGDIEVVFQDGVHQVYCNFCGGQWAVKSADTKYGFDFDEIDEGDGTCLKP